MAQLRSEWDEKKNQSNQRKHAVSFEEASTVSYDDKALLLADPDHSDDEDRFVILGMSNALRILVVCLCYRENEEVIRLVSARKADRSEQKQYSARFLP